MQPEILHKGAFRYTHCFKVALQKIHGANVYNTLIL